ncbi:MAG: hypothetical protein HQ509_06705 [Candidatus Marinimicrobia bacterium]|nr:hypothetical protein [Candidatus Neomarinimicrobiota bacterium]
MKTLKILFGFLALSTAIFADSDATTVNITVTNNTLDWCNLQHPENGTIDFGNTFTIYAQTYEPGVTDGTGEGTAIDAWIGFSTTNDDPSGTGWTWISAAYSGDNGNNDEYTADLGSALPDSGTYYYASRFTVDGSNHKYGGYSSSGGGFWDGTANVNGELTVTRNFAPEIATISDIAMTEDTDHFVVLSATDPNGDDITFSVIGGSTETVSGLVSNDTLFLSPAGNYNTSSAIVFSVVVTDVLGAADTTTANVTVTAVNDAPVIASVSDQNGEEGTELSFNISATDVDGDNLSWTSQNLPTGAQFTDNTDGTATFTWTPTYTQSGTYENILFIVDDGSGGRTQILIGGQKTGSN